MLVQLAQTPQPFDWMRLAQEFGFNALLVLFLIYAGYRVALEFITRVAVPMQERYSKSIDQTDEAIHQQTETLKTILVSIQQVSGSIQQVALSIPTMVETLAQLNDRIAKLERAHERRSDN